MNTWQGRGRLETTGSEEVEAEVSGINLVNKMGKGPGLYDFIKEVSGRAHLKPVDWTNPDHKRIVAVCLVEGVYVLECDRQEKGELALPPERPWFTFFNFKLDRMLIHEKDKSIYGAIYRFEPPSHLPPKAPEYVIAFRGTVLKEQSFVEDIKLNYEILNQRFHIKKRTIKATEVVESVRKDNPGPVWLVGHSLGSALAIQAGKKVAEKGVFLETFLFNPPYPSLGPEIIRGKEIRNWIQKKIRKLKIKLAIRIKGSKQIHEDIVKFANLSKWSPHVFVNQNDWIFSGYIGYFKQRKMSSSEINSIVWVLDAMYTTRALFQDALKRAIFKKKSDYEPFYLFPCASLTINTGDDDTDIGSSHEIRQWWMEHFQLKNTPYSFDLSKLLEELEEQKKYQMWEVRDAIMDTLFNELYDDEGVVGDDENDHEESHSISFDDEPDGENMLHNEQGQQMWEVWDAIANAILIAHS